MIAIRTNKSSKVAGQKSIAFLHTNNKLSEREMKKTVPFTTTPKRIKYLEINLTEELKDLYRVMESETWRLGPHSLGSNPNTLNDLLGDPGQITQQLWAFCFSTVKWAQNQYHLTGSRGSKEMFI